MRAHTRLAVVAVVALAAVAVGATGSVGADAPTADDVDHSDATDPSDPVILDRERDATITVNPSGMLSDVDVSKVEISGDDGSFSRVTTGPSGNSPRYHATPQEIGETETVDVVYNGSVIKTVTVETVERDTEAFNITASKLKSADSVNVSYPANETSFYLEVLDFDQSQRQAVVGVEGGDKVVYNSINKTTNATVNLTAANAGPDGSPVGDYQSAIVDELPSNTSQDVRLVASGHVSEIEIDGETVYNSGSDAPIGGGGGGSGGGGASLVVILIGAAAVIYLGTQS